MPEFLPRLDGPVFQKPPASLASLNKFLTFVGNIYTQFIDSAHI